MPESGGRSRSSPNPTSGRETGHSADDTWKELGTYSTTSRPPSAATSSANKRSFCAVFAAASFWSSVQRSSGRMPGQKPVSPICRARGERRSIGSVRRASASSGDRMASPAVFLARATALVRSSPPAFSPSPETERFTEASSSRLAISPARRMVRRCEYQTHHGSTGTSK